MSATAVRTSTAHDYWGEGFGILAGAPPWREAVGRGSKRVRRSARKYAIQQQNRSRTHASADASLITHASNVIQSLIEGEHLSPEAGEALRRQVVGLLRRVAPPGLSFPSIAPDEDDSIVLFWQFPGGSLEIDVDADGPTYLRERRGPSVGSWVGPEVLIFTRAKRALTTFSRAGGKPTGLPAKDPNWRG